MGLTERELCPDAQDLPGPAAASDARRWFAITVKPQHELVVQQALAAKGRDAYAPFYWTARRWSDRVKKLQLPLFPGYVFCRFESVDRTPVLRTNGVRSIVSFGSEPAPVAEQQIDAIRKMLDSSHSVEPWPFLRVGQRVQIGEGSLAGIEGILAQSRGTSRVVVNIDLLQRSVAVEVDPASLVPLN